MHEKNSGKRGRRPKAGPASVPPLRSHMNLRNSWKTWCSPKQGPGPPEPPVSAPAAMWHQKDSLPL